MLTDYQTRPVRRAASLLRPPARFERIVAGQIRDSKHPSDDVVRHAISVALETLGIAVGRGALPER